MPLNLFASSSTFPNTQILDQGVCLQLSALLIQVLSKVPGSFLFFLQQFYDTSSHFLCFLKDRLVTEKVIESFRCFSRWFVAFHQFLVLLSSDLTFASSRSTHKYSFLLQALLSNPLTIFQWYSYSSLSICSSLHSSLQ